MAQINPIQTSSDLKDNYGKYLKSLIKPRQKAVRDALGNAIDESVASADGVTKGPFLEATPPYVPGASIRDLIKEGALSAEFEKLNTSKLPLDRPLYAHQESAIRKIVAGRNVIVATGTGSGKTESFLFPILDSLMKEKEAGTLGPGVRALLLYPMNALANDQVKRIREILENYPEITFGRYTGETLKTEKEAVPQFRSMEGRVNPKNELISRDTIRQTPPNILLTNYAMLEYLLLRPNDESLFQGVSAETWKFIVADEAHTFDGAHGIEVATLLRKLRERISNSVTLQTIGTTATIGGSDEEIERFATNLFNNPFEIAGKTGQDSDLVRPQIMDVPAGLWGPVSSEDWVGLTQPDRFAGQFSTEAKDLYSKFQTEIGVSRLRTELLNGPLSVEDCAEIVFGASGDREKTALANLVSMGTAIKDETGTPAFSARFHLFARATEGLFGCMAEVPHFALTRHLTCEKCENLSLELAGCYRCGASYYIGYEEVEGESRFFRPEATGKLPHYIVLDDVQAAEDNEDDDQNDEVSSGSKLNVADWHLCIKCGKFDDVSFSECSHCQSNNIRPIQTQSSRTQCISCSAAGPQLIRKLESGNDAAASVLATELYQHMPPGESGDVTSFPGQGRKLMVFSDNRQQAAFFAPYIEGRYSKILWRKVVYKALLETKQSNPHINEIAVADLLPAAMSLANTAMLFSSRETHLDKVKKVAERLHFESVNTETQNNLEGTGLVNFRFNISNDPKDYAAFEGSGLSFEESKAVLEELLNSLRLNGVLSSEPGVQLDGELFKPRTGIFYVRESESAPKKKILAWLPGAKGGKSNSRLDYLSKVLQATNSKSEPLEVLTRIWESLAFGTLKGVLVASNVTGLGSVHRLDHKKLLIDTLDASSNLFECMNCGRTSNRNVRGVCPRYRCTGTLIESKDEIQNKSSFYREQFLSESLIAMSAKEHTAQLTNEEAKKIQNEFIVGKVNLLSSSTTFELGVDVGELQSVFLRNVPPSVANYLQRAGRAGRRADSAALILTYAQRKPHDLSKYANPVSLVAGKMRAPYVELENERILQRHIYSIFFSAFFSFKGFRTTNNPLPKAGAFFLESDNPLAVEMASWVTGNAVELKKRYDKVVPAVLKQRADLIWSTTLSDFINLLNTVREKLRIEVSEYDSLIQDALAGKANFNLAGKLDRIKSTIVDKDIIGFLAKANLIPKYGFPVDTVSLQPNRSEENAEKVDLDRDLSIAIFEYAPGSNVVAAGYTWKSVGLGSVPNKEFRRRQYAQCPTCDFYNEQIATGAEKLTKCKACQGSLPKVAEYIIPEWGFIASGGSQHPGETLEKNIWGRQLHLANNGTAVLLNGQKTPGARVTAELRTIAELVVINSGVSGTGFLVCPYCRAAVPGNKAFERHSYPNKPQTVCGAKFVTDRVHLGHVFQSDIVQIKIDMKSTNLDSRSLARATGYALLEGASDGLQIAHDDIDVIVLPSDGDSMNLALVDAVPAGAGFAKLIAENLVKVFESAFERVNSCSCGEDTSCYECLRTYRNQSEHELLVREDALKVLRVVLGR